MAKRKTIKKGNGRRDKKLRRRFRDGLFAGFFLLRFDKWFNDSKADLMHLE